MQMSGRNYTRGKRNSLQHAVCLKALTTSFCLQEAKRQPVMFLGKKLGPSRGLVLDLWAGLHYFLPRDHAAVRWDTRRPLSAESHTVLLQSARTLPHVSHMFLDSQWQVWAVVGHSCVKIQKYLFM